jgi:hypothetical protein
VWITDETKQAAEIEQQATERDQTSPLTYRNKPKLQLTYVHEGDIMPQLIQTDTDSCFLVGKISILTAKLS